jgi:hypothetical protein
MHMILPLRRKRQITAGKAGPPQTPPKEGLKASVLNFKEFAEQQRLEAFVD